MDFRYGMNPHQQARITSNSPIRVLNGHPSLINYLDALNAWQLVRETKAATSTPAATSFKHVSPAGAAIAGALDDTMRSTWALGNDISKITSAYARARDADPRSSFGDMIAVSDPVDEELADLLTRVVSDGIIAPDYEPGTAAKLAKKKQGTYLVLKIDPTYQPPTTEDREVFGVTLQQDRDERRITADLLHVVHGDLPPEAVTDALLGMITLRYTQSNSVTYVKNGMTTGIGAGQQSRVDCTILAGKKASTWSGRRHKSIPKFPNLTRQNRLNHQITAAAALNSPTGGTLVSDGYLPFRDNIDVAHSHGVKAVVEPGGSTRSNEILTACQEHGMTLAHTGTRLFHH